MRKDFPGLKPFYFWKKLPFTQWTVSENQFTFEEKVGIYGGLGNPGTMSNEITFTSTEQWMMWKKAKIMGDNETARKILSCTDPRTVKDLGRKVQDFSQEVWDAHKLDVVYEGNMLKFTQNPEWAAQLKQIVLDGYFFVEASPYDTVWGIGLDPADAKAQKPWRGQNLLGIVLTNVACDLIMRDQAKMWQEDVNYACVPICEALEKYLGEFIDVKAFPVGQLINNEFAELVDKFVEDNFAKGEFRHHH